MAYLGNTSTTQSFTPAIDYFSGNGSTTAFTLSKPVASVAQIQVVIDNVAQNPSSAYTVLNNTITFTSAPLTGTNNIYVYYTSPITQLIAPGQGTVNLNSLDSGFILPVVDGGTGVTTSTGSGNNVLSTSPTLITPNINSAQVATVTGTAPIYMCRAWCQYNGSQAIVGSANITSITINATGDSTLAFTTAMPDATYSAVASTNEDAGTAKYCNVTQPSTASIRVVTYNTAGTKVNNTYNFVAVFR